jgi:hypothetical protein
MEQVLVLIRYTTITSPSIITNKASKLYLTAPGIIVGKPILVIVIVNAE